MWSALLAQEQSRRSQLWPSATQPLAVRAPYEPIANIADDDDPARVAWLFTELAT